MSVGFGFRISTLAFRCRAGQLPQRHREVGEAAVAVLDLGGEPVHQARLDLEPRDLGRTDDRAVQLVLGHRGDRQQVQQAGRGRLLTGRVIVGIKERRQVDSVARAR